MTRPLSWDDLELLQRLGEGRAGTVWQAKLNTPALGLPSGTILAVKRYKPSVLEQPGEVERLVRELEIGRRLDHPNLVRTLTLVRSPDGGLNLVMQYYEGQTLEQYLANLRKPTVTKLPDLWWALTVVGKLAQVIALLHRQGVLHRDIKPSNIILTRSGPVLMDLGVVSSTAFPEQTESEQFLGTIRYGAPEYVLDGDQSPLADVYSLGAVAYELLTGRRFLHEDKRWARLVVRKQKQTSPTTPEDWKIVEIYALRTQDDYPRPPTSVAEKIQVRRSVEFARLLCETAVEYSPVFRQLDLDNLAHTVERRLWDSPFSFIRGVFKEGHGEVEFPEFCDEHPGVATPIEDVSKQLRSRLTIKEHSLLETIVGNWLWYNDDWYWSRRDLDIRPFLGCKTHALMRALNEQFRIPYAIRLAYIEGFL